MANFGEYKVFQSLHISHMDFLNQYPMFPFLLLTPHIIGEPLKFLVADIEYIASWSKAEGQSDLFSHWKEELWEARKSWSNFCAVVVPRQ